MDVATRIGARIRERRERAGLTQAQLAEAAFVTRQSVGNWEGGKTLPDVQSLQLVAQALGTTVDGLLGGEVPAMARETTEARRKLARFMVLYGALYLLHLACVLVLMRLVSEGSYDARTIVSLVIVFITLGQTLAIKRIREITRGRELGDAVGIMMFVEGYPEGQEPPNDAFYRVVLTNLPAFLTALYVLIVALCIAVALL